MTYDYKCKDCNTYYEKENTIDDRNNSGNCPKCGSNATIKVMSKVFISPCEDGPNGGGIR